MFELYNKNWYSKYVVVKKNRIRGNFMLEKSKQHMIILLPFFVLFLLILGSVLVEFKIIDVLYLITLIVFLIRYFYIKRNINK